MDTNDELQELNLLLEDHGMARAAVSDMIDYVYFDFVYDHTRYWPGV